MADYALQSTLMQSKLGDFEKVPSMALSKKFDSPPALGGLRSISESPLVILGGGIFGTTLAYWLSVFYEGKDIVVLEKEPDVAMHMSGRNTGVIHRPFYLNPIAKAAIAKAAEQSYHMWKKYAAFRGLPWKECGTVEVAMDDEQIATLHKYQKWAVDNGMSDGELEFLSHEQLTELEPNVKAPAALYCKTDTSVDFGAFTRALRADAQANGVRFVTDFEVEEILDDGGLLVAKDGRKIVTDFLVNCAGGNALKFAHMMKVALDYSDLNFRGEYWVIKPEHANLSGRNIYSVPKNSAFPFLDPHWVVCSNGEVIIGPNAVPVIGPYKYKGFSDSFADFMKKIFEMPRGNKMRLLLNPEFLKLSWSEWRSSISHKMMVGRLKQFMPAVKNEFLSGPGKAGVRSTLVDKEGKFVPEALQVFGENSLHILNYNSPGATGAPAYTRLVMERLQNEGCLGLLRSRNEALESVFLNDRRF